MNIIKTLNIILLEIYMLAKGCIGLTVLFYLDINETPHNILIVVAIFFIIWGIFPETKEAIKLLKSEEK